MHYSQPTHTRSFEHTLPTDSNTFILRLSDSRIHKCSVFVSHTALHLTYRGEMSQPCCMKAPSENQRELKMPNSLGGWSVGPCSVAPSSGSSACHSYGLKRLTWEIKKRIRSTKEDRPAWVHQNN